MGGVTWIQKFQHCCSEKLKRPSQFLFFLFMPLTLEKILCASVVNVSYFSALDFKMLTLTLTPVQNQFIGKKVTECKSRHVCKIKINKQNSLGWLLWWTWAKVMVQKSNCFTKGKWNMSPHFEVTFQCFLQSSRLIFSSSISVLCVCVWSTRLQGRRRHSTENCKLGGCRFETSNKLRYKNCAKVCVRVCVHKPKHNQTKKKLN